MARTDTQMRVPLTEVLGIPGFLYGEQRDQWLRDNNVEVTQDWAGRESVDLPTAWRLKEQHDKFLAKAQADAAKHAAHAEEVHAAQQARHDTYGRAFARYGRTNPPGKALALAKRDVIESEKHLPAKVRKELMWPVSIPMIFDE